MDHTALASLRASLPPLLARAHAGADIVAVPAANTSSDMTSAAKTMIFGTLAIGIVGGIGYLIYRDQQRFERLTPEQQHQERMDRLKETAVYSLAGSLPFIAGAAYRR